MTEISDNSGNSNRLVLNGNSNKLEEVFEREFKFKSAIQPTGTNALRGADNFGTILDTNGSIVVVGTPNHPYNSTGGSGAANGGTIWVYERQQKIRETDKLKKVKKQQVFTATGADQSFKIPDNVTQITVQLWGAGGGGEFNGVHRGGNGGYTKATFLVSAGKTYKIIVGKGGVLGGTTAAYGGGGYMTAAGGKGGSGGGRSAFADFQLGDMIVAGGGGGAGLDGKGGSAGGLEGLPGKTNNLGYNETTMAALGGNRGVPGQNDSSRFSNFGLAGENGNLFFDSFANNSLTGLRDKGLGRNASPISGVSFAYGNGAGGGGWGGGAAGPGGVRWRAVTSLAYSQFFEVNGSGAGGCGNVNLTPGFIPYNTEKKIITNAFMLSGDELNFGDELSGYALGGLGSTPGGDGRIVVEWFETEITEDIDTIWKWNQTARLTGDTIGTNFLMGNSVVVSKDGSWIFAGAPGVNTNSSNTDAKTGAGAVYGFQKVNGAWQQTAKIVASGTNGRNANDNFGTSIAYSGGYLFVGAPRQAYNAAGSGSISNAGAVYVFAYENSNWVQKAKIVATGTNARVSGDNFGYNISASEGRLAVASKNGYQISGTTPTTGAGCVFVYEFENSSWAQKYRVPGPRVANGGFGAALHLKGNLLTVEASAAKGRWIYERENGVWGVSEESEESQHDYLMQAATGWIYGGNSSSGFSPSGLLGVTYKGDSDFTETDSAIDLIANSASLGVSNPRSYIYYSSNLMFTNRPQWTMEYWIHPNVINNAGNVDQLQAVFTRTGAFGVYAKVINVSAGAGDILLHLYERNSGDRLVFSAGSIALKKWSHIAFVRDGNELRTYVGGDLINTYDITGKSFQDSTNDIYFGFTPSIPDVLALQYTGRFFSVRKSAAYKGSYVPSTYMNPALNPTEAGRGTSTFILDNTTILSGLPKGNNYDAVMYDSSSLRDKEAFKLEQQQYNVGLVEVITKLDSDNWNKVQNEIVPPGLVNKRQVTGFGAAVAVDEDFIVVTSMNDTIGVNGNRKNTQVTGSAWAFDIKDDFSYVRKLTSNTRSRSNTANGFGRAATTSSDGKIYISENNFTDIAKVMVNVNYFREAQSYFEYANTKQVWQYTSSGRVSMLTHREGSIDLTGEIVMDNRNYAAYISHGSGSGITANWVTTNPSYVYSRTLTDTITVDGDNELFVADINGTNPNSTYGDRTNYGSVARLLLDPVTNAYSFDEMQVDGISTADSRAGYAFGYGLKIVGDQILVGAPRSRFNGTTTTAPTNSGMIFSYKYSVRGQGWDVYRMYFPPAAVTNNNYGLAFDYNNGKLITRTGSTTTNIYVQKLDETDNVVSSQTFAAAGTNTTDNLTQAAKFVKDDKIFAIGSPMYQSGFRANTGIIEAFNADNADVFAKSVQSLEFNTTIQYRTVNEQFGYSVAMQGTKMLIGIPGLRTAPDGSVQRSGTIGGAKVYDFALDRWERVDTLYDIAETSTRRFGENVSWTPTKAIVRSSIGTTGYNKVFSYENSAWTFKTTISANLSANSVAIINDTLLVQGQPGTSPNTGSLVNNAGSFRDLTSTDATVWATGTNMFVPLNTNGAYEQGGLAYGSVLNMYAARNPGDRFGAALGISNDAKHLIIGAPNHNYFADPNQSIFTNSGAVFAYYWDETTSQWRLNNKLKATTPGTNFGFGTAISKADTNEFIIRSVATGSRGDLTKLTRITNTGRTATWANTWVVASGTPTNNENYGMGIAWDSVRDVYYVGAPNRSLNGIASGGFETITDSSSPQRVNYQIDGMIRTRNVNDNFSAGISLFEDRLAIGAPGYAYNNDGSASGGRGAVFTYRLNKENRFDFETKVTFEGYTSTKYGNWVGINNDTLVTYGVSWIPDIKKWDNSAWTSQTVTPNPNVGTTVVAAAWDAATGNSVSSGTTTSPNMTYYPTVLGGALTVENNGNSWIVGDQGIITRTAQAGGQLVNSARLNISARNFGNTANAISPNGDFIAVTMADDKYFESNVGYVQAGVAVQSRVYVFKREGDKFVYHSTILAPNNKTGFGNVLNWTDEGLFIHQTGFLTYLYNMHDDNYRWYVERSFMMESGTASTMVAKQDGKALVMAKPASTGYPHLANSGSLHTMVKTNGFWGSNRGPHAGADADITASTGVIGGGGGAGYRGGAAGASTNATVMGGAWGGTNLLPTGASEQISIGQERANAAHASATGAGGVAPGDNGENARIIITANGIPTVFDYTGEDQQYVVPEGTTSVDVEMWGAGGGAGFLLSTGYRRGSRGGAGAFVSGTLPVTAGETLTLMVGGGGIAGTANSTPTSRRQSRRYGLGGMGFAPLNVNNAGSGSGGGLAGILRDDEFLVVAGGGGGGTTRSSDTIAYNLDGMPGGLAGTEESSNMLAQSSDYNIVIAPGAASPRIAGDKSGYSVAVVDDNTVLAGAPGHRYSFDGEILPVNSGAIIQYKRTNGKWDMTDKLTSLDSRTGEYFGANMEFREGKLIVTGTTPTNFMALSAEIPTALPSSTLDLLELRDQGFVNLAKRNMIDEDSRGKNATLVGDQIVLGNPLRDKNATSTVVTNAGGFTSFDFKLNTTNEFVGSGISHGRFAGDRFGQGVEITATQIIVGAPGHSYTTNGASMRAGQGALFVFDKKNARYTFRNKLNLTSNPAQTGYGSSLKLIGEKLYVGTDKVENYVELTGNLGAWTVSKTIFGTAGLSTEIINSGKMIQLNPLSGVGVNGQPTIAGAGLASTFTIDATGTLTDATQNYTIPGNSNGRAAGDRFGESVYANHDFVVVGAPGVSTDVQGNTMAIEGALFVFNKNGDGWEREIKLVAPNDSTIGYGLKLAGSNGWIMTTGTQGGTARVFQRTAEGSWVARQDFTGDKAEGFASAIAMADTAKFVVGLPLADGRPTAIPNLTDSGLVQTWTRQSQVFTDRGFLSAKGLSNGRNAGDWFGHSIAANKSYVVVGSPMHSYNALGTETTTHAGAVWIYLRNSSKYPLAGKFVAGTQVEEAQFGWTVAINNSSNHIAIGEPGTKSVHLYDFDGEKLTLMQTITGTDNGFGSVIAMGSGKLAIGSPNTDGKGKVDVYALDASIGSWTLTETLDGFTDAEGNPLVNDSVEGDLFGAAVAIDGNNSIIVGAPGHDYDEVGADPIIDAGAVMLKKI